MGLQSQLGEKGCVVFQVKGDDKIIFDSGPIKGSDLAKEVSVSVVGIKELKLITSAGSYVTSVLDGNYAVWGEPRLVK